MDGPKPVKCVDCGLLALLDQQYRLIEAPAAFREHGNFPTQGPFADHVSAITCSIREFDLARDEDAAQYVHQAGRFALAVINNPRPCTKHFPWRLGFDPKEHLEMIISERALELAERRLEEQKQHNARIEQDRRDWEEREREKDRIWKKEQSEKELFWRWVYGIAASLFAGALTYYMSTMLGIAQNGVPIKP